MRGRGLGDGVGVAGRLGGCGGKGNKRGATVVLSLLAHCNQVTDVQGCEVQICKSKRREEREDYADLAACCVFLFNLPATVLTDCSLLCVCSRLSIFISSYFTLLTFSFTHLHPFFLN